jgi:proteasome accessory factor A
MLEPQRGTRAHVGELLDRCATASDLIEELNSAR